MGAAGALRKRTGRVEYACAHFLRGGTFEHKFIHAIKLREYAGGRVMHGYARYSRVLGLQEAVVGGAIEMCWAPPWRGRKPSNAGRGEQGMKMVSGEV